MDPLIKQLSQTLGEASLLPRGARVMVAVSGGLDSIALLHLLQELAPRKEWTLIVAHFNHGLRGRESDADERLVKRAASALGLECTVSRARGQTLRETKGKSLEMACRDARHEFFAKAAMTFGASRVALAHHADDQVELFWLRALRGGGNGLAGMRMDSPSPANSEVRLIRPLLTVSRSELAAFIERNGISFREDASNASRDHERNRVRNELMPFLDETFARKVKGAVQHTQRIVAAHADFVSEAAAAWLGARRRKSFATLHIAVQRECLRLQLIENGIEPAFDLIEGLRDSPETWVSFAPGRQISRSEEGMIQQRRGRAAPFSSAERRIQLKGDAGAFEFGGRRISWDREKLVASGSLPRKRVKTETFDMDSVGRRLVLRHWKPGDRFQPIGMKSPIKLQDLFVNRKIPRDERRRLLVATTAKGDIFWVEGCRIGELFKVTEQTWFRLNWMWENTSKPR